MTKKRIVEVSEDEKLQEELKEIKKKKEIKGEKEPENKFVPTPEAKGKAKQSRAIAIVLWILAIVAEIVAIWWFTKNPTESTTFWVVVLGAIAIDIVLCVIANMLWQKAHRLDPPSEKNKVSFFLKSQLGLIMTIVAFLPLIVLLLTNKDLNKKQKGVVGAVAAVALVAVAMFSGINWAPASAEQYAEQTSHVQELTGQNKVYWTKSGTKYHLEAECYTINSNRTEEIFEGTVAQARELKNITELCKICEDKWLKANTKGFLDDHGSVADAHEGHNH